MRLDLDDFRTILIFSNMLSQLRDMHVHLSAGDRTFSSAKPHALHDQLLQEFGNLGYIELLLQGIQKLNQFTNAEILGGAGKSAGKGLIQWGKPVFRSGCVPDQFRDGQCCRDLYAQHDGISARYPSGGTYPGYPVRHPGQAPAKRLDCRPVQRGLHLQ